MILQNMAVFPIPITYGSLGKESKELNNILVENIKEESNQKTRPGTGNGVNQTYSNMERKYPAFQTLQKIMDTAVTQTFEYSNIRNRVAKTSAYWGNYNPGNPSAYHIPHSHSLGGGSIFSGVYFPFGKEATDDLPQLMSTSKPAPGSLLLLDPVDFVKSASAPECAERYPFFGLPMAIEPVEGAFIIFPTYLNHMVVPTENENERFSIAFSASL